MSTELVVKRKLTDLSLEEKASLGQICFIAKAKGISMRELARRHNLTDGAVKRVIAEYGAYLRETNTHTKEASIVAYDYIIEKAVEIIENPHDYSVLLQAKSYEAFIQSVTRKDKLLGHEAPTHNIQTKGETMLDLAQRLYGPNGTNEDQSPVDAGYIGQEEEEIEDAEIVEDDNEPEE